MSDTLKQLRALGFAAKAGKLITGTEQICDALRKSGNRTAFRVYAVVIASDVSENTEKKLSDKCAYYGVPLIRAEYTMDEISHSTGKSAPVAAAALTDENICKLFMASL